MFSYDYLGYWIAFTLFILWLLWDSIVAHINLFIMAGLDRAYIPWKLSTTKVEYYVKPDSDLVFSGLPTLHFTANGVETDDKLSLDYSANVREENVVRFSHPIKEIVKFSKYRWDGGRTVGVTIEFVFSIGELNKVTVNGHTIDWHPYGCKKLAVDLQKTAWDLYKVHWAEKDRLPDVKRVYQDAA